VRKVKGDASGSVLFTRLEITRIRVKQAAGSESS